ncbi:Hypothetical protein SRAE_X000069500 [Strongyloides ratti]|uniref:Uncharacterized protein n=1 Tax=Strongyloides ratti TaxID=34506 RepID=A0A090N0V9_STRRB|nr:Hypothetical protein SRAE_X000069500 [Strongyloides ratti]CEF71368.1 Hypothetical protein SRAE_X000069500 [Strongyloides ratti]
MPLSGDIKSMMAISSESNNEKNSKEINNNKPIESISRTISGETKDVKDYEEYFDRNPDTYLDDLDKNTNDTNIPNTNDTLLFFPIKTRIFIDKMLPIFDGSTDKKEKYYQIENERFANQGATRDDFSKTNNNTSNIF